MSEEKSPDTPVAEEGATDTRYVGFCDILGFSNRILTDFDKTLEVYREFGSSLSSLPVEVEGVTVTMYSDALLITSNSLGRVASAIQRLWFVALTHDLMIRDAITKGRYWEERQGNHLMVASDALVRAVKLEKSIGVPAVFVADDVEISDDYWLYRFHKGVLAAPFLHFRDRNIVNPFNNYWFQSASVRTAQLMMMSPEHKDKYLWFLALHIAVGKDQELIPPDALARLLRDGKLTRRASAPDHT